MSSDRRRYPTLGGRIPTIWSIQYLRAFAAIGVVIFHQLEYRAPIFKLGAHGVDLFFVISGFIMITVTDGKAVSPARFVIDRATRIVPLYWLATFLVVIVAAANLPFPGGSTRVDWLIKSLLFIPEWNVAGHIQPTLFVGWTLNLEMLFYAIFALCLFLPARYRPIALAMVIASLALSVLSVRWESVAMQLYTDPIMIEFAAGAAIGRLFGGDLQRRSLLTTIVWSVAIIAAMAALVPILPRLIAGWAAVAIVVGCLLLERAGLVPKIALLRHLGDASFAIYLFQSFAVGAVSAIMAWLTIAANMPRIPGVLPGLQILAAVGLGVIIRLWIERPMTKAVRAVFANAESRIPASATLKLLRRAR